MVKEEQLEKEIIFFSKNTIGGVQSYNYNIISNDPYNDFHKKWILVSYEHETDPKRIKDYNLCEELIFPYSDDENIFEIAKRLSKNISNTEGVVIPNTTTELATLHLYPKSNKTILFVCHEDGSLDSAIKYEFLIDGFIAHNPFFYRELKRVLPERSNDVFYLPYGVNLPSYRRVENKSGSLKIIFIARLQKSKGVDDLALIAGLLKEWGIKVNWTIVGAGPEKENLQQQVKSFGNFEFVTPEDTEGVLRKAAESDIFILPSRLDGLPVAMLEAMSVGLVPIVTEFNPGISEVISEEIGFVVPVGDVNEMAKKIALLDKDRDKLELMSIAAHKKIIEEYSIKERTRDYYDLFRKHKSLKKPIKDVHIKYGSLVHRLGIPKEWRKTVKKILGFMKLKR